MYLFCMCVVLRRRRTCTADAAFGAAFIAVWESMTLAVYDFNSCLRAVYPIACGRALGNKEKPGDMKTPEGFLRPADSGRKRMDARFWRR